MISRTDGISFTYWLPYRLQAQQLQWKSPSKHLGSIPKATEQLWNAAQNSELGARGNVRRKMFELSRTMLTLDLIPGIQVRSTPLMDCAPQPTSCRYLPLASQVSFSQARSRLSITPNIAVRPQAPAQVNWLATRHHGWIVLPSTQQDYYPEHYSEWKCVQLND